MVEPLADRLRDVLARAPGMRLAILFGSHARGTARPDSDVDIAILVDDGALSFAEEAALGVELERVAGAPVDLVRIGDATGALSWRIARDGRVLVSRSAPEASRFFARAAIEHDDLRELELDAARRYRARLAGPQAEPR